jgi:MFS family permease
MRFKLSESPVFQAMKDEGELAGNPFTESFTYPGNKKRIFIALFGVAAGLTVIWYTAMFSGLTFLTGPMRVHETTAQIIVGASALVGMGFFVYFGSLSDRIGRKKPIVWGYVLTLILIFPCFWLMGWAAHEGTAGPAYFPTGAEIALIVLALLALSALSGATYGPVAALLAEMFPPKIRYSSMSIPYHIGTGYFGGFLPLIATLIIAKASEPESYLSLLFGIAPHPFNELIGGAYSGLWYTWLVVLLALAVSWWGLPSGPPREFHENGTVPSGG